MAISFSTSAFFNFLGAQFFPIRFLIIHLKKEHDNSKTAVEV